MLHVAARQFEIRRQMMSQRGTLIGLPAARASCAFQFRDVFPVDGPVVNRTVFDFGRLNSPAEVRYFILSPSSTALRAMMRRPFLRTMVSAAARPLTERSATLSKTVRIREAKIMRGIFPF